MQEELDLKVLVFQNKKLTERIEQRKKAENELRKRIEQLENRQRTDDAVLMIVNRYWNQVCVRERERESVSVCVCVREREREIMCVCVCERERERECVCV